MSDQDQYPDVDIQPESKEPLGVLLSTFMPSHKADQLVSMLKQADDQMVRTRAEAEALNPEKSKNVLPAVGGVIITDDDEPDAGQALSRESFERLKAEIAEIVAKASASSNEHELSEDQMRILEELRQLLEIVASNRKDLSELQDEPEDVAEQNYAAAVHDWRRVRGTLHEASTAIPALAGIARNIAHKGVSLFVDILKELETSPENRVAEFMDFYDLPDGRLKDYMERRPERIIQKFQVRADYTVTHLYAGGVIPRTGRLIDHGKNILFRGSFSTDAIEVLLAQVEAKGWERVHLSGSGPRTAATYVALVAAGYEVVGYEPSPHLRRQAELKARTVLSDAGRNEPLGPDVQKSLPSDVQSPAPEGAPTGETSALPTAHSDPAPEATQARQFKDVDISNLVPGDDEQELIPEEGVRTPVINDDLTRQIAEDHKIYGRPDLPDRDDDYYADDPGFDSPGIGPDDIPDDLRFSDNDAGSEATGPGAINDNLQGESHGMQTPDGTPGVPYLKDDRIHLVMTAAQEQTYTPQNLVELSRMLDKRLEPELEARILADAFWSYEYAIGPLLHQPDARFDEVILAADDLKNEYVGVLEARGADVSRFQPDQPEPPKPPQPPRMRM